MTDWQPIETAPMDEDVYFLIATGNAFKPCEVVSLGWTENGGEPVWFNGDVAVEGTHWMPLPEPPPHITPGG